MDQRGAGRRAASWLCRTDDERGRMVDMSKRLRRAEIVSIGTFGVLAIVAIATTGIGLIAACALGAACFGAVIARMGASRRPEHRSVAVLAVGQAILSTGILLSSGPRLLLVVLPAGLMLIGAAVWPARGVIAGTGATAALVVGLTFAVDAHGAVHAPVLVLYPLAVLLSTAILASAARGADVASRATAAVDRLTGLLNRAALLPRAAELSHQTELTGEPVALLLGDIDHFKRVNDEHGHATGDEALKTIAARLRAALGEQGSIFRFGGEELVVLAPGLNAAAGTRLAGALRVAVEREPVAALPITISFGVAASQPGEPFDFEALFGAADAALYGAKAQGRNRVCAAAPATRATTADASSPTAGATPAPPAAAGSAPGPERRARDRLAAAERPAPVLATAATEGSLAAHIARHRASTGSWLLPDETARVHMLDLLDRLRKVRVVGYALILATLAVGGPNYGWWPVLPPVASALLATAVILNVERLRRPELALAAALMLGFCANASSELLTHGHPFASLSLLTVPVFAWAPAFPRRAVIVAAVFNAFLIAGAAIAMDARIALADPLVIGTPLCMLVAITAIGTAMGRSAVDYRGAAVIDGLTGMLNRAALESRAAAVAHEAAYSGAPVALVVGDVDRFKLINDRAGHATGDAVLREVAYRIRKSLRAFEAAYRIGGEEFVVLLGGVRPGEAAEIAERLRQAIRGAPVEGLAVTMSFGVAATEPGSEFEYERLFARADSSLYDAKRGGRDRVVLARPVSAPDVPVSDVAAIAAA